MGAHMDLYKSFCKGRDGIQSFFRYVLISMTIGVVSYLPVISRGLTNSHDGLWKSSYHQAGNLELSAGRWAWLFLDKIRGGYAAEPFNSLLTLLLLVIGIYIVFYTFGFEKHHIAYSLLIIISPTVCCYLSYRFMSPTFGMSFLLVLVAGWLSTKSLNK